MHLELVSAWRQALTEPTTWRTPDGRPPASSSDCIAAAVVAFLETDPDPLDVARYATRIRLAHKEERLSERFPQSRPASFYLPENFADQLDALLLRARTIHQELADAARAEARELYPGGRQAVSRYVHVVDQLAQRGLPAKVYVVPAGTVARMAIERWRRRAPRSVVAAAVEHAHEHHTQLHRARRDMGTTTH
ncbi:hypothetical protein [Nocardia otitidiscaviarum]|uniref:hypothetical protein n=1 Tax=Nocardia otitidiscaviarum TaxID=1823 RepID=UPI0002F4E7BE|nr:hypothetical protein [Nocardia otitidiscaviarum]